MQQPSMPEGVPASQTRSDGGLRRLRWAFLGAALALGIAAGVLLARQSRPSPAPALTSLAPAPPVATWDAGEKPAPGFSLRDENGRPVSLDGFRGRPVLLTFIDPLCRDFCPLEAKVLNAAMAKLPASARPQVIAVSVNRWGNSRATLLGDTRKWGLTSRWHWGIAAPQVLHRVWASYEIAVKPAGGHDVVHTEATFLIDANGDQRALWLWPFQAADVARTLRGLGS